MAGLRFSLEEGARAPEYGSEGAAGIDLFAKHDFVVDSHSYELVHTGVRMAIPRGCCGVLCDRSGNGLKKSLQIFRGVIDSDYRGEIIVGVKTTDALAAKQYPAGFKLAQMLILPAPQFALVEGPLDDTPRGASGFGSTDEGIRPEATLTS